MKILAEVRACKVNAENKESADFLEFQWRAGLGQAEVAALDWEHVDWPSNAIAVQRIKTKSWFRIPIYPNLRPLLLRRWESAKRPTKGRIFRILDARHALSAACERLALPRFTQRNLRQHFLLEAVRRGVDVRLLAEWQNHKDGGKLILSTYTQVITEDQERYRQSQIEKLSGPVAAADRSPRASSRAKSRRPGR